VSRWAFLGASALSGIVCDACGAKLTATFESRVRLTAGGILLGTLTGSFVRTLGGGSWGPLAIGFAVIAAWFLLRTEAILALEPAKSPMPSISGRPS
jgi:hypothetical protein